MKLTALNPRWFTFLTVVDNMQIRLGLTFDCPCCQGTEKATRLAVDFDPPLDPLSQIDQWGVDRSAIHAGARVWQRTGDSFETLTLSPSLDASHHGHWHGFIVNGEIKP